MRETSPLKEPLLWRSILFAVGLVTLILLFATIGLCSAPLPYRFRYSIITLWNRCVLGWLRMTCNLTHTIEGMEHIPEEPGVILCKHQSAWETIALGTIFGPQTWLLKRELLWIPFFGWGLALLRPIAIDRGAKRQAMTQLVTKGKQRLQEGLWVVAFPEGTRTPPGTRGTYSKGAAALAVRTGRYVVPVAHNAGDFWPRRSIIKYPGVIQLVIGPPINTHGRPITEVNTEATEWIEATVTRIRLSGEPFP